MNQTFIALIREATFTKEMLGAGATQIRTANYTNQGVYAQAFSGLSIGLERIGKLCLMLDHYIEHDGSFPDFEYLKKSIGHKLELIQKSAAEISTKRNIDFQFIRELNHPIHLSITKVLHAYADGDRYSNINILVGAKQQNDPIAAWFTSVDTYIFENLIKPQHKVKIANAALAAQEQMPYATVLHTAETGEPILNIGEASFRTGVFKAVAPYRQFFVLQVIRYWVELLWELGTEAQKLDREEIPFLGEIFAGFYNEDSYLKSKKTWEF